MGKNERRGKPKPGGKNTSRQNNKFSHKRSRPKEIVFDPEARRDYLRGFSDRKKERRAFGLAMQKVKDRNEKIEARRDRNKAMIEQVEEAEKQKEEFMEALLKTQEKEKEDDRDDADSDNDKEEEEEEEEDSNLDTKQPAAEKAKETSTMTTSYNDGVTRDQWGGHVIVTCSTKLPDDYDDDDDDERERSKAKSTADRKRKTFDEAQQYAGKVDRFLDKLKGNMPAKKKAKEHRNQKGRHGALNMKGGAANSSDFKIAQKALARTNTAQKGKKKKRSSSRK